MIRTRKWFFETPEGTSYDRFSVSNRPTKGTFQDLLDSICFKSEVTDLATTSKQGLVIFSTDAEAEARNATKTPKCYQLPGLQLTSGVEPSLTGTTAIDVGGLKLTAIESTVIGGKRMNFKIEFNPTNLTEKTTPTTDDFIVISDVAASNVPKKAKIGNLSTLVGGYWGRNTEGSPYLAPGTQNDDVNLLNGLLYTSGIVFNANAASIFSMVANKTNAIGVNLKIVGGAVTSASTYAGGNLYLYGGLGSNGGAAGDVMLSYNGSAAVGNTGIGCAPSTGWRLKVCGDAWITGAVTIGSNIITDATGNSPFIRSAAGVMGTKSMINFTHEMLGGAPSGKSLLYYDGSVYTVFSLGSTSGKFLKTTTAGAPVLADLVLTNTLVVGDLNSSIQIPQSYITDLVTNLATLTSGVAAAKTVVETITEASTSQDLTTNYTPSETYIINVSAGSLTFNLPTQGTGKIATKRKITIIRKTSDSTKTLTIYPTGSNQVVGENMADAASIVLSAAFYMEKVDLIGNGLDGAAGLWQIVSHTTGLTHT